MVQGKGKFEELMVCSREIAASTAQLVAASKVNKEKGEFLFSQERVCYCSVLMEGGGAPNASVCWTFTVLKVKLLTAVSLAHQVKADKDNTNLQRLQQASRGVTQATAAVVASTKSGKSQIEETGERGSCR